MTGLDQYLENIYNNCKIPFKAYIDGKVVFEADPVYFQSEVEEDDFLLGFSEVKLIIPGLFKESLGLLKFCIKDKFCEYSIDSEKNNFGFIKWRRYIRRKNKRKYKAAKGRFFSNCNKCKR